MNYGVSLTPEQIETIRRTCPNGARLKVLGKDPSDPQPVRAGEVVALQGEGEWMILLADGRTSEPMGGDGGESRDGSSENGG